MNKFISQQKLFAYFLNWPRCTVCSVKRLIYTAVYFIAFSLYKKKNLPMVLCCKVTWCKATVVFIYLLCKYVNIRPAFVGVVVFFLNSKYFFFSSFFLFYFLLLGGGVYTIRMGTATYRQHPPVANGYLPVQGYRW